MTAIIHRPTYFGTPDGVAGIHAHSMNFYCDRSHREIYARLIEKHQEFAQQISCLLCCIATVKRPLSLRTLLALAAPEVLYFTDIALESDWIRDVLTSGLVHQSAKDNSVTGSNAQLELGTVQEYMHYVIAERLLTYLESCWAQGKPDFDTQNTLPVHSGQADLVYYALEFWQFHARCCGIYANEIFNTDRLFFCIDPSARMYWTYLGLGASPPVFVTGLDLSQANFLWDQIHLSAIHVASLLGNVPWLKLLLEKSGTQLLDSVDGFGVTPLQYAALGGHSDAVHFILNSANVSVQYGRALWFAVIIGCADVARLLVQSGANVDTHDEVNQDLVDLACTGDDECDDDDDITMETNIKAISLLMTAIESCHPKVVEVLLSGNANLKPNGQSAVCHAAAFADEETMKVLIHHGANIEDKDDEGKPALYHGLVRGDLDILRVLVEWRFKTQEASPIKSSKIPKSDLEIHQLLSVDPNIHSKDKRGRTALHSAVFASDKETINRLLWLGLDTNARDSDGNTPLHAAMGFYLHDLMPMRCLLWDKAFDQRVYEEVSKLARWSFHCTPDQRCQKAEMLSPFPGVGAKLDVIRLLIIYGASIDAVNDLGQTPWSVLEDAPPGLMEY